MPLLSDAISLIAKKIEFTKPIIGFVGNQPCTIAATAGLLKEYGVFMISPADMSLSGDDGLRSTIAHEIGHIYHRHMIKTVGSSAVITAASCLGLLYLSRKLFPREEIADGITPTKGRIYEILECFLSGVGAVGISRILAKPLSRYHERQADSISAQTVHPKHGKKKWRITAHAGLNQEELASNTYLKSLCPPTQHMMSASNSSKVRSRCGKRNTGQ